MNPTGPSLSPPTLELRVGRTGAGGPGREVRTWLGAIGSHRWCVSRSHVGPPLYVWVSLLGAGALTRWVGGGHGPLMAGWAWGWRRHLHSLKPALNCPLCLSTPTLVRAGWLVGGKSRGDPWDLHPQMGEQGVRVSFKGNPVSSSLCLRWGPELSGCWGTGPDTGEGRALRALGCGIPGLCPSHDGICAFPTTSP